MLTGYLGTHSECLGSSIEHLVYTQTIHINTENFFISYTGHIFLHVRIVYSPIGPNGGSQQGLVPYMAIQTDFRHEE